MSYCALITAYLLILGSEFDKDTYDPDQMQGTECRLSRLQEANPEEFSRCTNGVVYTRHQENESGIDEIFWNLDLACHRVKNP